MLIYAMVYMLNGSKDAFSHLTGEMRPLEDFYFEFVVYIGIFLAVFTSMFLGTEYSDGTMRNKLVVGHTRTHVYLANLIVSFVAGLLIMCTWLITALVGIPKLGLFTLSVSELMVYFLICVLLVAAYSAINTLIAMLSSNKTATVLISILLFFGLLLGSSILYEALNEPETISSVSGITISGVTALTGDSVPNPNYIGGAFRSILQSVLYILPTGQSLKISALKIEQPYIMVASSVVITAVLTVVGIVLFRKKDLK